jgi:hypothetical protein
VCERSTDDPLIRLFLDRYGLHLLQVPRESAAVGDFYVDDGRRVSPPGNVRYLLDPSPELPAPREGERMADIEGVTSKGYSLEAGLGLLEGFLLAFGPSARAQGEDRVRDEARSEPPLSHHRADP